jgi:hypothetical protein
LWVDQFKVDRLCAELRKLPHEQLIAMAHAMHFDNPHEIARETLIADIAMMQLGVASGFASPKLS